jgi:hypothetical protein
MGDARAPSVIILHKMGTRRILPTNGSGKSARGSTNTVGRAQKAPIVRDDDNYRRPLTVALIGAHCSGKTTLGQALAARLGWRFDEELGAVELARLQERGRDGDELGGESHLPSPPPGRFFLSLRNCWMDGKSGLACMAK